MNWTDTHAHLYDCTNDELRFWTEEAVAAGVTKVVNTANSLATSYVVLDQCVRFADTLLPAVGISPFDSVNTTAAHIAEIEALLMKYGGLVDDDVYGDQADHVDHNVDYAEKISRDKKIIRIKNDSHDKKVIHTENDSHNKNDSHNIKIVAVGEIGLDCTNAAYPSLDIQTPVFISLLELAGAAKLPAIVHSRGMEKKTAEVCRDVGVTRAVFHCFTGDDAAMEYITDCGYFISISGIVTYKKSHLPALVQKIPRDKLLLETDAPYLSPVPLRGQKNKPSHIINTAKFVAALLEMDDAELSALLEKNFIACFGSGA